MAEIKLNIPPAKEQQALAAIRYTGLEQLEDEPLLAYATRWFIKQLVDADRARRQDLLAREVETDDDLIGETP